ncbi:transposase [Halomonas maura]|uniref:transposase n=1 Tax=Halomonas maura TaxID=117606 RepID=UPI00338F4A95
MPACPDSRCRRLSNKPELARRMLEHALDQGIPASRVTRDSVYGGNRSLRLWLWDRAHRFVLAVTCNEPLWWQSSLHASRRDRGGTVG